MKLPRTLVPLGWDEGWAEAFPVDDPDAEPGRVVRVDRGLCTVRAESGVVRATYGGNLLASIAEDPSSTPCTGDWVVVRHWPDDVLTIDAVLPRRTSVTRAEVTGSSRVQVLAANLDVVAVVAALVPEPVIGKLERLLALAWSSGARTAVLLTKTDLVNDAREIAEDVAEAGPGADVICCSVVTGEGLDELRALVGPHGTLGLVGPSGAGKSSLVNALVGTDTLPTREIRADGRGRHTSVARELVLLPGGGAVVDTPGLRGVGLIDAEDGLASTFGDIEELAGGCRFNDCSHTTEPGCAVLAAVEEGTLPVRRLESWRKLRREMAWMATRTDVRLRREQTRLWKQRTKDARQERRRRTE